MNRKLVIGLIGGIGAGKSTAAEAFTRRGGCVVSGDPAGHAALYDPEVRSRIAKRWPESVGPDGAINRKTLGKIVFADQTQLKELEAIVFPWIADCLHQQIATAQANPSIRFIVLDAAVMLEAGWDRECDRLVFVDVPQNIRAARVAARGWTADELDRRESAQLSLAEKRNRADAVLDNSVEPIELQGKVDALLARWGLMTQPV